MSDNSVFLPKTDFPLHTNLKEVESKILQKWEEDSFYGEKCQRCWKYEENLVNNLCERCR